VLESEVDGRRVALLPRTLVGRGELSHLRIDALGVSSEHAAVYYINGEWRVRDLGSRNGTWLADERLEVGVSCSLRVGDTVRFGNQDSRFTLVLDAPAGPCAREKGGGFSSGAKMSLWLPSEEHPMARVYLSEGQWLMETVEGPTQVSDGEVVSVGAREFELLLPRADAAESGDGQVSTLEVLEGTPLKLTFRVSQDEEHVALKAKHGHRTVDLGARAHNYLLLMLARRRQEDTESGVASAEAGWIYANEMMEALRLERSAFNVQIWRALQVFKQNEMHGSEVIERRKDAGQLRLGVAEFSIES